MLVLIEDKVRAIQEAKRVIRPNGSAGWLELTWKKPIPPEFLRILSDVICAYCMLDQVGIYLAVTGIKKCYEKENYAGTREDPGRFDG